MRDVLASPVPGRDFHEIDLGVVATGQDGTSLVLGAFARDVGDVTATLERDVRVRGQEELDTPVVGIRPVRPEIHRTPAITRGDDPQLAIVEVGDECLRDTGRAACATRGLTVVTGIVDGVATLDVVGLNVR